MNFTPGKLFVIVGYPRTGKTRTIQTIFHRKQFFPFKQPIKAAHLGNEPFIVINISDHNHRTDDYLDRIKSIMQYHLDSRTSFVVVISLAFDDSIRDVKGILTWFNHSGFDIHYLVLYNSWHDKKVISEVDMEMLQQQVENGTIHLFDRLVTQSGLRFNERVDELKAFMVGVLEKKGRWRW